MAAGLVVAAVLAAQFASLPQAQTPEEFDAYLRVLEASTPSEVIAAGDAFTRAWPASALCGPVYEMQFEAYRKRGEAGKAIEAAEKALEAAPDNLVVLAELAVVLANGTRDPKRLTRAGECARKVIALAKALRLPKSMPPQEWDAISARLNSQAHVALGLVANASGDLPAAIREFETAIALAPAPDAAQYYRLGLLYRASGNIPEAIKKLRRAAELDEPLIQQLARQALAALEPR